MKKAVGIALLLCFLATPLWSAKTLDELFNEAAVFLQDGKYDEAVAKYLEAIELDPKSVLAYNLLGMAFRFRYALTRNEQDKKDEIAAFEEAIKIDPDYWVSLINLGATYHYLGNDGKAAPYFKKALEIYPEHPEAPFFREIIRAGDKSKQS
ncbi:MAG: tetratricopeptide repeat protein [Candidatus Omnitrophica bacterium]|nr:tetratricopeptide repeat protein [Candidatus Omnitrophota bacterium]